uniref:Uncharacterized protein n=1 Tax=Acrobeloides nanus TaxID=290746 RepID=A0A914CXS8_9BILA
MFVKVIFLLLAVIFAKIEWIYGDDRSLCIYMTCQYNALASNQKPVRACEECRLNNTRFCGEISRKIYCFHKIPNFCQQLSNEAKRSVEQVHQFCYLPDNQYLLRTPIVEKSENDTAINFAIPRFFEDKEYEEYDFSNLTLFIKHDAKTKEDCESKFFNIHYISSPPSCLITIPVPLPRFDSNSENDPFYYDDQTDMSIEFSRDLLKTLSNSNVSTWYSVQAIRNLPHGKAILKFGLPLFSYRKDIVL